MKYLSYVLWPLIIGYAAYSLIYNPHKRYYSFRNWHHACNFVTSCTWLQLVFLVHPNSCQRWEFSTVKSWAPVHVTSLSFTSRVRVRLHIHASSVVPQLQAQVGRPLAVESIHVQGEWRHVDFQGFTFWTQHNMKKMHTTFFLVQAFNTFIDDVFAFIIVMPTAHRIACFRDDVVFVIYLYQRWWVVNPHAQELSGK